MRQPSIGLPWIEFTKSGCEAECRFWSGSTRTRVFVRYRLSRKVKGWFKNAPENVLRSIAKYFGSQDVVIGFPPFDDRYVLKGRPERAVRELFEKRTKKLHRLLRQVLEFGDLGLDLSGRVFRIDVRRTPTDRRSVLRVIRLGNFLCEKILTVSWKKKVMQVDDFRTVQGGSTTCQVCGTPLRRSVVRCRKCRTAHHPECWHYTGVCSTYGCGSRTALT